MLSLSECYKNVQLAFVVSKIRDIINKVVVVESKQ